MKKIEFKATNKYGFDTQIPPTPASEHIPDWWKNMTPYVTSPVNPTGKKFLIDHGLPNTTFKKCVPMLDSITNGYIISLWSDVKIQNNDGKLVPEIHWRTTVPIFEPHGTSSNLVPPPPGYSTNVFKYLNTWLPITPKGYSILVTSPLGYRDLPFQAIPAIIDSDTSRFELLPPMWLREGFEGVIEKGTPLLQIIPLKRDNWQSETSYNDADEYRKVLDAGFNSTLVNHYIKKSWTKKTFK